MTSRFINQNILKVLLSLLVASIFLVCLSATAIAGLGKGRYHFLRFKEDWTHLRGNRHNGDMWNRIKYIPIGSEGSYASFGGQARLRFEKWDNFAFAAANDDTFSLWRLLVHGDFHCKSGMRLFIEGKTALSSNRTLPGGRRTLDHDTLALQQLFLDIPVGDSLVLRPGRQEFLFGKQRLVSPYAWSNTLRTWDGLSGNFKFRSWDITGFYTHFVPVVSFGFNRNTRNNKFAGFYGTSRLPGTHAGWDLYWFYSNNAALAFDNLVGRDKRNTLGTHIWGKFGENNAASYDTEVAFQTGNYNGTDTGGSVVRRNVYAYMFSAVGGYLFRNIRMTPRVYIAFDYASGGNNRASSQLRTFNQLFPLGHAYFGGIDIVGRQNISDVSGGVSVRPMRKMKAGFGYHIFNRANNGDALYNSGGAVVRAGNLGASSNIGNELELYMKYGFNKHFKSLVGYSRFFAGSFISQSGAANNTSFAYVQLKYIV